MNKYDLVVFDLDGTLMDTSEGILTSVRYTIEKNNLPRLSDNEIMSFIGPPIQDGFKKIYGLSMDEANELAACFRQRYSTEDLLLAKPYDDIYEVLDKLRDKGIKLGIATNKREDYAKLLLNHYAFDTKVDFINCSDLQGKNKKKDLINLCIIDAGITDKKRVLMVGDTENDNKGAHEIGVDFLAVSYGFGYKSEEDIAGSVGISKCTKDINAFVLG